MRFIPPTFLLGLYQKQSAICNLQSSIFSVKELREENQRLRDENNRLKGEQGKPDIKAKKNKGELSNHSSEKERETPKKHTKTSKNESIKIDREEILEYPRSELLLAYRDSPRAELARQLKSKFWELFDTKSGYEQLDERKRLTEAIASELLLVLEQKELPLHNNPAELAARTMVQRRNISYATQTTEGTKAIDTFMSLVATTRKLGISFFEYVRDRISKMRIIPSLATIIREKSSIYPFGWSWQPE
ncbi:MAG: transposase [Nostoc sp.]|uniref:IS66 family transposase n=1 Tax=Nostoc sp. TaxID=1180 RepID=UPI002FFCBC3B